VAISDGLAIVGTSGYHPQQPGIWIVDLESESNPSWFIVSEPHVTAVAGTRGFVYGASEEFGLGIIDVRDRDVPLVVGRLPSKGTPQRIAAIGNRAYTAGVSGLAVLDLDRRDEPLVVGQVGS
jgi:hypothetical protein